MERDRSVLEGLASYRFLSIPQLTTLFFPSRGAAEARLRRLLEHRLVTRVFLPVRPYSPKSCTIYALSRAGAMLLADRHDGVPPPSVSESDRRSGLFLDHTLHRSDVRICAELLQRQGRWSVESWLQKPTDVRLAVAVETGKRKTTRVPIVPDGCLTVRRPDETANFDIEVDMGTVRLTRMALRYRAFWTAWKNGDLAKRHAPGSYRVLTITTTERRMQALRTAALRAPTHGRQGSGLFWFTTFDEAVDIDAPKRFLDAVWRVARVTDDRPKPLLTN